AAVVICPGGGYGFLAMDHEGHQAAEFLNTLGIAAYVLKYRIVAKGRPGPLGNAPLLDAQRAIRTVRANATEWKIDPAKIGIWGFSAGGHLASTAATHFSAGQADAADPIERVTSRPDFAILSYPVITTEKTITHGGSVRNLLGDAPTEDQLKEYSNELHVTAKTPPTFLFHTSVDTAVLPENALRFYQACVKMKVPVEMHIYEKGPHGVGLGRDPKWTKGETSCATWPDRLGDWLRTRQFAK
ncbi:MAG: alpha/beta hydrolase, partial [Gemmataceae bacterium]